jgi:hypothetical protein
MEFNHVVDEDIIAQFYATVHLSKTGDREITWMTRDKLMKTTWAKFGECFGYPVVDDPTLAGLLRGVPWRRVLLLLFTFLDGIFQVTQITSFQSMTSWIGSIRRCSI